MKWSEWLKLFIVEANQLAMQNILELIDMELKKIFKKCYLGYLLLSY